MDIRLGSLLLLTACLAGKLRAVNGTTGCDAMPCQNGGECFSFGNTYFCVCLVGFQGRNCEMDVNECASNPCQNGATCEDLAGEYSCICPPFYSGVNCETDVHPCQSNPCENGATCTAESADFYICTCVEGYSGANCELEIDECASDPCLNNATCEDLLNEYNCTCGFWYSGVNCETDLHPCLSNPCGNNGTCSDVATDFYICFCAPGFTGENCETEIDECASDPCLNDGTCEDLLNGYNCICPAFYTGVNCETDVHPCRSNPCENGATCTAESADFYNCTCVAGYSGANCELEIDECASDPCLNNATCEDLLNEYNCTCSFWYSGVNCETDLHPCLSSPCGNNGTCSDVATDFYVCFCAPGFTGENCEMEIDECASDPCLNGGTCEDLLNEYNCTCPAFYTGVNCETDVHPCISNPCENGGTCTDLSLDSYSCTCQPGYSGDNCELGFCSSFPCENNGTCTNEVDGFQCACPDGVLGDMCEINIDDCAINPCANGGMCVDEIGGYRCVCSFGWDGVNCTEPLDLCEVFPCLNGGTCQNFQFYAICMCPMNYEGVICETYVGPPTTSITTSGPDVTSTAPTSDTATSSEPEESTSTTLPYSETNTSSPGIVNSTQDVATLTATVSTVSNATDQISSSLAMTTMETVGSARMTTPPPTVPITTEPLPITSIEEYVFTIDPANTTFTVYTQRPAKIQLIVETALPGVSTDIAITSIPDDAIEEIVNTTEIGITILDITTSKEAYTTILVTTRQPSDILVIVETVDAENTAAIAIGILNVTLPTTPTTTSVEPGATDIATSINEMSTEPVIEDGFSRYLNTQGNAVLRAYISTESPANYSLVIYTRNPDESVSVSLETVPEGVAFDIRNLSSIDPEAFIMTFKTSEAVNTTLIIRLMESANISLQVDTADQSSNVLLEDTATLSTMPPSFSTEMFTEPMIEDGFSRYLSTQGNAVVRAYISTDSPANYSLVIYTRNPDESVSVSLETVPEGVAFDLRNISRIDPEAFIMTFKTSEAVNTTLIIRLMESANISLQVDTADQSSIVHLEDTTTLSTMQPSFSTEMSTEPMIEDGFSRYLSTQGNAVVRAYISTESPANYSLVIYTRNPDESVSVSLETVPKGVAFDIRNLSSIDPEAFIMTFKTSKAVNTTLIIRLMESANVSLQVDTADQSSIVLLEDTATFSTMQPSFSTEMSTEAMIEDGFSRFLSTQANAVVRAYISTESPANYSLVIYTRNPDESVSVSLETVPEGVAFDVRNLSSIDPEAFIMTFKTSEAVNTTLIIRLMESANISLQVDTADQSSIVLLEDTATFSTMQPSFSTEMSTEPLIEGGFSRYLSTQGNAVLRAYISTESPANYSLVIYTRNPDASVSVSLETVPEGVAFDIRNLSSIDPEAFIMTFKTSEAVNATLIIRLMESANISLQVDTADQSSIVLLEDTATFSTMQPSFSTEMSTEPMIEDGFSRYLRTQGNAVVRAYISTESPANYSLVIYTRNPDESVSVSLETVPEGVAFDISNLSSIDPEAFIMTFKTSEAVNTTLIIRLMESANISLQVDTADQSSIVLLEDTATFSTMLPSSSTEMSTEPLIEDGFSRYLSTQGNAVVRAYISTESPANYSLVIYTRNPDASVSVSLETVPEGVAFDIRNLSSIDPEAFIMTFKTSKAVNTTLLIRLMESANVSLQVDTADQSSIVLLEDTATFSTMQPSFSTETSTEPMIEDGFSRYLSTQGNAVVRAYISTESPANYSLVIYTRNPDASVSVSLETVPEGVAFDIRNLSSIDPEAFIMTFKTSEAVNATLIIRLMESANISLQVDTADQSSIVLLEDTATFSTMQPSFSTEMSTEPMIEDGFSRYLRTQGNAVVRAYISTESPANYSLVIYTRNPDESVSVSLETVPEGVAFDISNLSSIDPEAFIMTFKTSEAVNTTFIIRLMESANISLQVDTADQSSIVLLEDTATFSTMLPSSSTEMSTEPLIEDGFSRYLSTQGNAVVRAYISTESPANYSLVIYTRNPDASVSVSLETVPEGVAFDIRNLSSIDPEAFIMTFKTSEAVNTTLLIRLMESANVSLQVDTADQSSIVLLEDTSTFSTMQPSFSTETSTEPMIEDGFSRYLSTQGNAVVRAYISTESPANYSLVIYTRNPDASVSVSLETVPEGVAFDIRNLSSIDPEAFIMTFKTSEAVNATLIIRLMESANFSLQVDTADQSSIVLLEDTATFSTMLPSSSTEMSTEAMIEDGFSRFLSTQANAVVRAYISTESPANYSLVIYTRNPDESVSVSLETVPEGVAFDVRNLSSIDPEAFIMTFKTSEAVNTTLIIRLMESANISLQVDTADQSSIVLLEDTATFSTMQPSFSTEMSTEPLIEGGFSRYLSTQGNAVLRAYISTESPANYSLVIYTRNPDASVSVSLETVPEGVAFDIRNLSSIDPEAFIMTFKTSEAVNATLIIRLMESANISLQVDTADQSSIVLLEDTATFSTMQPSFSTEMSTEPMIEDGFSRYLRTQGNAVVRAYISTESPANYSLVIYTRNPDESVSVSLETVPEGVAFDISNLSSIDPEAFIMTFKTSEAVNTTLIIRLMESANISLQVDTADQSSIVLLEDTATFSTMLPSSSTEMSTEPLIEDGFSRYLSTQGNAVVRAYISTESPANYSLVIYTRNPDASVSVSLETVPEGVAFDIRNLSSIDPEAFIMTFKTSEAVNTTLLIRLMESANVSLQVDTADQSSIVLLEDTATFSTMQPSFSTETSTEPMIEDGFSRYLSTQGNAVVRAYISTESPANYSLVIYTRNPDASVSVSLETVPEGVAFDIRNLSSIDPEAFIMTFKTSEAVNATLIIRLMESANFSLQVDTADQSSIVLLEDTATFSTMQPSFSTEMSTEPMIEDGFSRYLSTQGNAVVRAYISTESPANYSLVIYTRNPDESVSVSLETVPEGAVFDMRNLSRIDPEAFIMTFKTSEAVNTTLIIRLMESANISLQVYTADQSSIVLLEDTATFSTMLPSSSTEMSTEPLIEDGFSRYLSTQGNAVLRAYISTESPANYSLVIYTRNPDESVSVSLETVPEGVAFDMRNLSSIDPEAFIMTFKTSEAVNTTLIIRLMESANISLQVDTADQSSIVLLEDTATLSTMQPSFSTEMSTEPIIEDGFSRYLSTQGNAVVRAYISTESPANYSLVIYTRNPNQTSNVYLETVPEGVAFDINRSIRDDSKAFVMTFSTSEAVNTTLIIRLMESANISLQVGTRDEPVIIQLMEAFGVRTTLEPVTSTEIPTERMVIDSFTRTLQTQGSTTVRGFTSTLSPANYTLLLHTINPVDTVDFSIETVPPNLASDRMVFNDSDTLLITFSSFEAVNTSLRIRLLESANISFQLSTRDPSSVIVLENFSVISTVEPVVPTETTTEPTVVQTFTGAFSSQGNATVIVFICTMDPACLTLLVRTRNPTLTVNVMFETVPSGAATQVQVLRSDDPELLMITLKTSGEAKTTFRITLQESANVTLSVDTTDQATIIDISEDPGIGSTAEPLTSSTVTAQITSQAVNGTQQMTTQPQGVETVERNLSTRGSSVVRAFASTNRPAYYTLVIYTRNPNQTVNVSLETIPAEAAYDVRREISDDPEKLTMTFRTSEAVNTTLIISLLDSANISLQVDTEDNSSVVILEDTSAASTMQPSVSTEMLTEPVFVGSFRRTLSTQGEAVVLASVYTRNAANYTLIVSTANAQNTTNLSRQTEPEDAAYDVKLFYRDDNQGVMMMFKTLEAVNTTILLTFLRPANITFLVETLDSSSVVSLEQITDIGTTTQPSLTALSTDVPDSSTALSTSGSAVVEAYASTSAPANFTLVVYTDSPENSVYFDIGTEPADTASDVKNLTTGDGALAVTFRILEPANTTLSITLLNAANISLQVDTSGEFVVRLEEVTVDTTMASPDLSSESSQPATSQPSTSAPTEVQQASRNVSTPGPANITFRFAATEPTVVYIFLNGSSQGSLFSDPEGAVSLNSSVEQGSSRYILTTTDPANITFVLSTSDAVIIETTVVAINADDVIVSIDTTLPVTQPMPLTTEYMPGSSTAMPTVPPVADRVTLVRELRTSGVAAVEATASTLGPGNYSLVIHIPNPQQNTRIDVSTVPSGVSTNFRVSALQNPEGLSIEFMTSEASDVRIVMSLLASTNISFTVETVNLSSTSDLLEVTQPVGSTGAPTLMPTLMMSTDEGQQPVIFVRELMTTGPAMVQATATLDGPGYFELDIFIPAPDMTTGISIQTIPEGLTTNLEVTQDDDPEKLNVRFTTLEAAYTLIQASLTEPAVIYFRVETSDVFADVELESSEVDVTPDTVTEVDATPDTATEGVTTGVLGSTITDMPTPSIAVTTSQVTSPTGPLTITRMLSTGADVSVEAFSSLDRPANLTLIIYIKDPLQSTSLSVLTRPQGLATNFQPQLMQNPEAYILKFSTSAAADTTVLLRLIEAANITFTVETSRQGSITDQVDLFVVGAPTTIAPIPETTPVMLMNSSQSVLTTGPSQSIILINAKSAASILIDVNGSAEFNITSNPENAVQVEQYATSLQRSFLRLIILSPGNITVTVPTQQDVRIVTTVMSAVSDAALVFIVTEVETASTVLPSSTDVGASTSGTTTRTDAPSNITLEPPISSSVVRTLRTYRSNAIIEALVSTTIPANITLEIFTPNPRQSATVNVRTVPSDITADFGVVISDDLGKKTVMFRTLQPSNTTITITLTQLANISLTVTNVDDAQRVTLRNLSEEPSTSAPQEVRNVTRTAVTSGAATSLVYVRTFEPSTIYLFINASAEISLASEPVGAVQTENLNMLGTSALKLTSMVPSNVTLFVSTSEAVRIQVIVESVNSDSAIISIEDEIGPTDQPFVTSVVVTSPATPTRTKGPAVIVEVTGVFSSEATVFWNYSQEDERFIQGFILQYREPDVTVWTNTSLIPPSSRMYTLTNLKTETLYVLRLITVDKSDNPAAFSFQKPVMTLSRNISNPVPAAGQVVSTQMDPFYWILIGSAAMVLVLLVIVVVILLRYTGRKKLDKYNIGGEDNLAIQEDEV